MAEGFELVRTIRQHLRRAATLLDEGNFDEALAEVDAALALDAHSLPAQALRDRIQIAKTAGHAPLRVTAIPPQPPRSFVPHGVNAASWHGFEQRITERRFRALLETINTSLASGDLVQARAALDEARELKPDAPEVAEFQSRISTAPVIAAAHSPATRVWMRAMGAAAMFLIGVSMLLGLEWARPTERIITAPVATPQPAVAPAAAEPQGESPELGPVPVAINDEDDSVPAIETPPEPLLRPRATTGIAPPPVEPRPVVIRQASPPIASALERRSLVDEMPSRANADMPVRTSGEVPDDFVASRRSAAVSTDVVRSLQAPRVSQPTPASIESRVASGPPAASVVPAGAMPVAEQSRVEEVLRRYARAYGQLDASAARAVWPSVDEKALARAFQNLASQNVSFHDCDIDIRGAVANASCRGQASYVGKVGSREPRTEAMGWRFELRRDGDAWKIEQAEMRRQSAASYQEK
jgi:tetratricopeptide (TPR) repeat protein